MSISLHSDTMDNNNIYRAHTQKNLFPIDDGVINARTTYVVCLCSIERSRCDRIDHELLAFLASESVSLLFFSSFYDGKKTFRRSAVVRVVAKF